MAVLTRSAIIFFIIICTFSITLGKQVNSKEKKTKCVGISVNGVSHKEKVLINGVNRPYQLSFYEKNRTDHILYFSYNVGLQNESNFEIGYSERMYPVPVPVKDVKNGFATAIDRDEGLIYLGGSEGIYVHNLTAGNKNVEKIVSNHDIWDLFYKDSLYFIAFPSRRLYKHKKGYSDLYERIHEKIYHFVIDGDGDTFISNKTGLFMIKRKSYHRIHIKGPKVFRAFEVDSEGVAHFCGQNEVYVVDKETHTLKEIAKIKNIFGLTFDDDDNMIFSDPHQVVKLEPEECEGNAKKPKRKPIVDHVFHSLGAIG